jgi:membrane protein required for colicin V production
MAFFLVEGVTLNAVDIIVTIIIMYGMYRGYQKGVLKQAVGVIGVIIAVVLGIYFNYIFKDFFMNRLDLPPHYITFVSFAAVFVIVLIIVSFVFKFLDDLLTKVYLGGISKSFGALFGGYFAALVLSLLLLILSQINIPSPSSVKDSVTYPYMRTFVLDNARLALRVLPLAKKTLKHVETIAREKQGDQGVPAADDSIPKPTPIR